MDILNVGQRPSIEFSDLSASLKNNKRVYPLFSTRFTKASTYVFQYRSTRRARFPWHTSGRRAHASSYPPFQGSPLRNNQLKNKICKEKERKEKRNIEEIRRGRESGGTKIENYSNPSNCARQRSSYRRRSISISFICLSISTLVGKPRLVFA